MKKHQRISILLTCLLLALPLQTAVTEPLQINAAEALPAGGITTTVSDSRFIDAGWMNQNIILTLDGQVWAMGINMMKDYPVFLSNDLGVPQCILGDTAVIDVFLNAINEQLKAQVFQSDSPVFDTGTGSYIYNSGQTYYQLNANVKNWLITTLQQQLSQERRSLLPWSLPPATLQALSMKACSPTALISCWPAAAPPVFQPAPPTGSTISRLPRDI